MTSILFEIYRTCCPGLNCNYLSNQKLFPIFLIYFWNLRQILNILKTKLIVIATLLQKLQAAKDLVRPLSKKQYFRRPFDSQHVKGSQTLVKSAGEHFHHIFSSL